MPMRHRAAAGSRTAMLCPLLLALGAAAVPVSPAPAQTAEAPLHCTSTTPDARTIEACETAARLLPRDPAPRRNLAMLHARRGDHARAARAWRDVIALDPGGADAHLALGRGLDRLGKREEALQAYEAFARLAPRDPGGAQLVGWMLLDLGREEEALARFRDAVRLSPAHPGGHAGSGAALASLSRHEEALRAFGMATRLEPTNAANWGDLARSALALKRLTEAVAAWERALVIDPAYFDRRPEERMAWERSVAVVGVQEPARLAARGSDALPVRTRGTSVPAGPTASGSGFIVSPLGDVLTNKHVVSGCRTLAVRMDGGTSVPATVRSIAGAHDLALLATSLRPTVVAAFRDGPPIRAGDDVIAVGFPLAGLLGDQVNVTRGSVNSLAGLHNDKDVLQMSAPVQPGSSGGPLFDASGNVVGIVVTKLNAKLVAEELGDFPQNVNFAIKEEVARAFLASNGIRVHAGAPSAPRSPADVGDMGRTVTALVECYR